VDTTRRKSWPQPVNITCTTGGWILLIATFKLVKGLLLVAAGVGALKLLHKDVGEVVQLCMRQRWPSVGRLCLTSMLLRSVRMLSTSLGVVAMGMMWRIGFRPNESFNRQRMRSPYNSCFSRNERLSCASLCHCESRIFTSLDIVQTMVVHAGF
jgi:hypothetical protein